MFSAGLDVGPDGAERSGVLATAERSRDLVVQFRHPQRPLCLIVVESHLGVFERPQDLGLLITEPARQIPVRPIGMGLLP